jgi:hypothetical protein
VIRYLSGIIPKVFTDGGNNVAAKRSGGKNAGFESPEKDKKGHILTVPEDDEDPFLSFQGLLNMFPAYDLPVPGSMA